MKIPKEFLTHFDKQIKTLKFLEKNILSNIPKEFKSYYAFGGGTALSLCYFQHRLSFDIDIFVYDNQLMNYINPQTYFEEIEDFIDDYMSMSHQINMISRDGVYINILSVENLNPKKNRYCKFDNFSILVETPEEIIAKKILYRKNDNKVRDIFDIAFAINNDKNFLKKLLDLKYITKKDLKELYQSIQKVNEKEIEEELKIISPFKNLDNIINIIKSEIKQILNY